MQIVRVLELIGEENGVRANPIIFRALNRALRVDCVRAKPLVAVLARELALQLQINNWLHVRCLVYRLRCCSHTDFL